MRDAATVQRVSFQTHQGPPATSPPRQHLVKVLVVSLAAVLLVAAGVLAALLAPRVLDALGARTFAITGDLTISGSGIKFGSSTGECTGDSGYADINSSTSIVVTDASGTTVAIGSIMGEGRSTNDPNRLARPIRCLFIFKVADIPEGSDFYGITLGRRGTQQYSRSDLREPVHLSIG